MRTCKEEFEKWMKENGFDDIQFRLILWAAWQAAWEAREEEVEEIKQALDAAHNEIDALAGCIGE